MKIIDNISEPILYFKSSILRIYKKDYRENEYRDDIMIIVKMYIVLIWNGMVFVSIETAGLEWNTHKRKALYKKYIGYNQKTDFKITSIIGYVMFLKWLNKLCPYYKCSRRIKSYKGRLVWQFEGRRFFGASRILQC